MTPRKFLGMTKSVRSPVADGGSLQASRAMKIGGRPGLLHLQCWVSAGGLSLALPDVAVGERDESVAPSVRKCRRLQCDTLTVNAERIVER